MGSKFFLFKVDPFIRKKQNLYLYLVYFLWFLEGDNFCAFPFASKM